MQLSHPSSSLDAWVEIGGLMQADKEIDERLIERYGLSKGHYMSPLHKPIANSDLIFVQFNLRLSFLTINTQLIRIQTGSYPRTDFIQILRFDLESCLKRRHLLSGISPALTRYYYFNLKYAQSLISWSHVFNSHKTGRLY